jgi:hypothetical protein
LNKKEKEEEKANKRIKQERAWKKMHPRQVQLAFYKGTHR